MAKRELSSTERDQLKGAASSIIEMLRNVPKGIGLTLNPRAIREVTGSWTGGEWTRIGTIKGLGSLELWVDRYTGWEVPQFWYGLGVTNESKARKVAEIGQAVLGKAEVLEVTDLDSHRPNDAYDRMKHPLSVRQFGRPLLHLHGFNNSGYGVYELIKVPCSERQLRDVINRAARFFSGMALEAAGLDQDSLGPDLGIGSKRNVRGKAQKKGAWKRHASLMNRRKKQDGYTCQICRINFRQLYGAIGARFANVHHVVSLASGEESHTSLKSLRTVCANCHAMLGRAPNGPAGFKLVKSSFTWKWPKKSV